VIFASLFWLTMRRDASGPVCGMKVDRHKAVTMDFAGETHYFCSEHCRHAFEVDPERYLPSAAAAHDHAHADGGTSTH